MNEMGVASSNDEDPDELERTALHLLLKRDGRVFCRSCSIIGVMLTRKTVRGQTVMSRMEADGDEILSSMVGENGVGAGNGVDHIWPNPGFFQV